MAKTKDAAKEEVKPIEKEIKDEKPKETKPEVNSGFDALALAEELGVPEYAIYIAKHHVFSEDPDKIRTFVSGRRGIPFRITF